jgi:thiamine-monophosphate kinase
LRGEDRVLAWLREQPGTELLGDDAAHLPSTPGGAPGAAADGGGGGWVVTTDPQIGGVHVPADLDEILLARRLLHVNLSDLAASGAEPAYALVALAAPEGFQHKRFFHGLLEVCEEEGVKLAGGDLARTASRSGAVSAVMTLLGTLPEGASPLTRSTGRPGDRLWVGGTLGESGAGRRLLERGARLASYGEHAHVFLPDAARATPELAETGRAAVVRHLAPRAQVALGRWLVGRSGARAAALDLSDGLARDLPRLVREGARESGVTAVVDVAALPLASGFEALCAVLETNPLELALGGGEDYVLLFTLPPDEAPPAEHGCHAIGHLEQSHGEAETLLLIHGERRPMPTLGWDHLEDD